MLGLGLGLGLGRSLRSDDGLRIGSSARCSTERRLDNGLGLDGSVDGALGTGTGTDLGRGLGRAGLLNARAHC